MEGRTNFTEKLGRRETTAPAFNNMFWECLILSLLEDIVNFYFIWHRKTVELWAAFWESPWNEWQNCLWFQGNVSFTNLHGIKVHIYICWRWGRPLVSHDQKCSTCVLILICIFTSLKGNLGYSVYHFTFSFNNGSLSESVFLGWILARKWNVVVFYLLIFTFWFF